MTPEPTAEQIAYNATGRELFDGDTPAPDTLPPFSGPDGRCAKCAAHAAETRHTTRQAPYPSKDTTWYDLWLRSPDRGAYPVEWLARRCMRCSYRWDETVADPFDEEEAVGDGPDGVARNTTAAGATVDLDVLPPFSGPRPPCLKCGLPQGKAVGTRTEYRRTGSGAGYVLRTCGACRYEWNERTADADGEPCAGCGGWAGDAAVLFGERPKCRACREYDERMTRGIIDA